MRERICIKVPKVYDWVNRAIELPLMSFNGAEGLGQLNFACSADTVSQRVQGGPLILMGIDAEDGGPGGHGPITVYIDVVNSILANVNNGGSGILVIGGGKDPNDNVTQFWDAISSGANIDVTYVNGPTPIMNQSFDGFAMLAITSDVFNTPFGGLTQAENDALATRRADVAQFVNTGGGLLGFTSDFTNPYAYLADVGAFQVTTGLGYSNITPTPEGMAIGITDALDVFAWHDVYNVFPDFLDVLATNTDTGDAAAIGGVQVVVANDPCQVFEGNSFITDCFLSDAEGLPVDPFSEEAVLCRELDPNNRTPVTVTLPSGETITLERVKVLIAGHFVVEVSDLQGLTTCLSNPIPFTTVQTFFLCAPEGTEVKCHLTMFDCDSHLICEEGQFSQLDVSLPLCVSIQTEADVKLEVEGKICKPREEIIASLICPPSAIPPQCPEIFPGARKVEVNWKETKQEVTSN